MALYLLRTLVASPHLARDGAQGERIGFSKQLALLIYLAAKPGGRATRDELISLLWQDSATGDARRALRQVVFQLRHAVEEPLVTGEEALAIGPARVVFDVETFRELVAAGRFEEALGLYTADFVGSLALWGAREFEQWAEGLRQQLAAERRQVLRTLIARRADQGQWREAGRFAELLADADPYDPEPLIRLTELLALSGDAVRAQITSAKARNAASEVEGGVLRPEIEAAISRALSPSSAPERRTANGFPRNPEMVGRAEEFGAVVERWKVARSGHGGAILITGEAGIGKTRLTRELIRRFERDRGRA